VSVQRVSQKNVVAGVDVGNATTEVVLVSGGAIVGAGRVPTRGRKGSADSLRAAAALVRRLERQTGCTVTEARIAPLRAVGTSLVTVPEIASATGRLRVLAAGVPTPGGVGVCVGRPLPVSASVPGGSALARAGRPVGGPFSRSAAGPGAGLSRDDVPVPDSHASATGPTADSTPVPDGHAVTSLRAADGAPVVALVPDGVGYERAARLLRQLLADGVRIGAVLVAGDEGVLIANRLPGGLPVIDQVDVSAAAACELLAVEVCQPGRPLRLLTDAVALAAGLSLDAGETTAVCRTLTDYSNAVVGLGPSADPGPDGDGGSGSGSPHEPWVVCADGEPLALRAVASLLADWPAGTVRGFGAGSGNVRHGIADEVAVDDLFAVDLSAVAEAAAARQVNVGPSVAAAQAGAGQGRPGRAVLVAALDGATRTVDAADELAELLEVPVRCPVTEPTASRLGALTTPGASDDAVVIDLGAGTIDVIAPDEDVVAAGAGELLTAAVAHALGIPRALADWVKRGPCIRVDGGQRYEAEDGTRGFLDVPAPASAAGMLAVHGPGGLLPFDRRLSPAEWRAMRVRIKSAVLIKNTQRAMGQLKSYPSQLLVVGGPAGDEELLGLLARALPDGVAVGRGNTGGTLGSRYAAALGLALAEH
jgi:hypothetical protein